MWRIFRLRSGSAWPGPAAIEEVRWNAIPEAPTHFCLVSGSRWTKQMQPLQTCMYTHVDTHSYHLTGTHLQPHTGANLHTFSRFAAAAAGPDYRHSAGLTNIRVNSCLSDSMSHSKHVVIGRTISTESSKSALLTKVVKQMRRVNICFQNVEEWSCKVAENGNKSPRSVDAQH